MNKYHNGKIYKIVDSSYTKQYIGSTTEKLSQRMTRHRSDYRRHLDGRRPHKMSVFDLFDEFGIENCKIELIEYYKCETREELLKCEGNHIKSNNCVNKQITGRTDREYYVENKDRILQQIEDANNINKEQIKHIRHITTIITKTTYYKSVKKITKTT